MSENSEEQFFECTCEKRTLITTLRRLCSHVQYDHFEIDEGSNIYFACPFEKCPHRQIYGFQNIKRHFDRNHQTDQKLAFLWSSPPSAARPANQSNSHANQASIQANDQPALDDLGSDISMGENNVSVPILLSQRFVELNLEDKLCSLIVRHKKVHQGITAKACLDIAEDYRKFYCDYLESGMVAFEIQTLNCI